MPDSLSSRRSEATVGIYRPGSVVSHAAETADPDTRSLRSRLRDDIPPSSLRSFLRDDTCEAL
jgi:hypothetical protein